MSNTMSPLVTIITPSYNQGKFIQETIDSVLQQDYRNIEHIVVDGGSTDNTLAILQQYAAADPRFRFISEKDRGQSHAINKGLSMARGEIVGWLNSDDTYLPAAISKAVQALLAHPEWGMVHGNCHIVDEANQILNSFPSGQADAQTLFNSCCICQPAAFVRKHVFEQMGGVDENLQFCMDYELWMRIAKQHVIGNIPEFLAHSRYHSHSKTATQWQSVGIPEVLNSLIKHYGSIPQFWLGHAAQYRGLGVFSLISKLKSNPDHNLPRIVSTNRSIDLWTPPIFRVQIVSNPQAPAHSLIIKGRLPATNQHQPFAPQSPLTLTALVNSKPAKSFPISKPTFLLDIPLDPTSMSNVVDISTSRLISPASLGLGIMQAAGFIAEEVIPLSREESILFHIMTNGFPIL